MGVRYLVYGGKISHFYLELAYAARPVSFMDLLVFPSPAMRLQVLATMSGLSVGSEDGAQALKYFISWAISPDPDAGTF